MSNADTLQFESYGAFHSLRTTFPRATQISESDGLLIPQYTSVKARTTCIEQLAFQKRV